MLLQIGQYRPSHGPLDLLLACHGKIRHFMLLASNLSTLAAAESETASVASQVRRYFQEAFPLHIADEEELIEPLLRLRDPTLAEALSKMRSEHRAQEATVERLLSLCSIVELTPQRLVPLRHQFKVTTDDLRAALESHLADEELVVFPAISRLLSAAELDSVLVAMRLRRERAFSTT